MNCDGITPMTIIVMMSSTARVLFNTGTCNDSSIFGIGAEGYPNNGEIVIESNGRVYCSKNDKDEMSLPQGTKKEQELSGKSNKRRNPGKSKKSNNQGNGQEEELVYAIR